MLAGGSEDTRSERTGAPDFASTTQKREDCSTTPSYSLGISIVEIGLSASAHSNFTLTERDVDKAVLPSGTAAGTPPDRTHKWSDKKEKKKQGTGNNGH
jgi:hypothetical protein